MGVAGPQGPPYPDFWHHEETADQPSEWSRSDKAVLLLVIAGSVVAVAIVVSYFI